MHFGMEGLWQLLFLASLCDLRQRIWISCSCKCDLSNFFTVTSKEFCVFLCWNENNKIKSMIWPTISKPQYSFHVVICSFDMALVCHTPLWHMSQRVSGWYLANCSLNASYFCRALLTGAVTDWQTALRPGIWCLGSYLNTMFSVKYDLMSTTSPKCLSLLLPEELRFFFFL